MKSGKSVRKLKLDTLAIVCESRAKTKKPMGQQVQQSQKSEETSEAAKRALAKWMTETFGTEDQALQEQLLCGAASTVSDFAGRELETFDHLAAALRGIRPQDSLEGMLATQMVAVHTLAMEFMKRAALPEQTDLGVEVNVNRATRLIRTFANQTEALSRYRGKGEHKMTVEHVHVYRGGQAIMGQVSQNNTHVNTKNGGGQHEPR